MLAVICRILLSSEMKMFPALSTAILVGFVSAAVDAAIPLAVSTVPRPAIVVMMPVLTEIFFISSSDVVVKSGFGEVTKMYMFPIMSNAMPDGSVKMALVAGMLSKTPCPPPATVVIMPVLIVIFLILPLALSAM